MRIGERIVSKAVAGNTVVGSSPTSSATIYFRHYSIGKRGRVRFKALVWNTRNVNDVSGVQIPPFPQQKELRFCKICVIIDLSNTLKNTLKIE